MLRLLKAIIGTKCPIPQPPLQRKPMLEAFEPRDLPSANPMATLVGRQLVINGSAGNDQVTEGRMVEGLGTITAREDGCTAARGRPA